MSLQKQILTIILLSFAYILWMTEPGGRVYWPFLISAYFMAFVVFHDRGYSTQKSIETFFSKKVWLHETTLNEALLVIFCYGFSYYLLDNIYILSPSFFNDFFETIIKWLDIERFSETPSITATIIYIVVSFMALDFGYFLAHYLMHKYNFLWEFHKVHHSALVMTPLTSLRQHPMEIIFNRVVRLIILGVVNGTFFYLYPYYPTLTVIASTNAILFVFLFLGSALGHSNIWVSFGAFEKVFISPSMHQIHHSNVPKHFNKNFGLALSIWDRFFGTLYLTPSYEEIEFGLGAEDKKFQSLKNLILDPFQRSFKKLLKPNKTQKI